MLLILLSFLKLSSAQAQYLPEFNVPAQGNKQEVFPRERVKHFRVQVFPHLSAYATPQGREPSAKSVSITSTGACLEHQTALNSDLEWVKGNLVKRRALPTHFSAGPAKFAYFECVNTFVIHRGKNLKSIEYGGDFVVVTTPALVKVINIIEPEDYIKGVIPAEVMASWPDEVLKAQAIAARTYAWWTVAQMRNATSQSDMDDTVSYQAYLGVSNRTTRSDQAADATSHIVMSYAGEVIKSYFSADSGGYTEDASEVFEPLPYCKANRETYDLSLYPASAWTKIFTFDELKKALVSAKLLKANVSIQSVEINNAERTASGRARSVQVVGSDRVTYTIDGSGFRFATKIKSNLFDITKTDQSYVLSGRGFGHGVGMAQIGALQYAKQLHWTYDQILNFYYSGVNLVHD